MQAERPHAFASPPADLARTQDGTDLCVPFDSEIAPAPESDAIAAWLRFSDDAYPAAASSAMMQW